MFMTVFVLPPPKHPNPSLTDSASPNSTSSVVITRLMLNLRDPALLASHGSTRTGPSYRFRTSTHNLTTIEETTINYTSDYAADHRDAG